MTWRLLTSVIDQLFVLIVWVKETHGGTIIGRGRRTVAGLCV
jgi:hypothetical protein